MLEVTIARLKAIIWEAGDSPSATAGQEWRQACISIREAWTNTRSSILEDEILQTYYTGYLQQLTMVADELKLPEDDASPSGNWVKDLYALILHLLQHYALYVDGNQIAAILYQKQHLQQLALAMENLRLTLSAIDLPPLLKEALTSYLRHIGLTGKTHRFTYAQLGYLQRVTENLACLPENNESAAYFVKQALIALNYNKLDFILYIQRELRQLAEKRNPADARAAYQTALAYYAALPVPAMTYDPLFPSIQQILTGWLREEIQLSAQPAPKLEMDLSVAHLAGLVKLLYEEDFYQCHNLTTIFQFFAGHFSTRRQPNISARSLSKAYYTIDQVTAAFLQEKLSRMLARLNRQFFPVVLAATLMLAAR